MAHFEARRTVPLACRALCSGPEHTASPQLSGPTRLPSVLLRGGEEGGDMMASNRDHSSCFPLAMASVLKLLRVLFIESFQFGLQLCTCLHWIEYSDNTDDAAGLHAI